MSSPGWIPWWELLLCKSLLHSCSTVQLANNLTVLVSHLWVEVSLTSPKRNLVAEVGHRALIYVNSVDHLQDRTHIRISSQKTLAESSLMASCSHSIIEQVLHLDLRGRQPSKMKYNGQLYLQYHMTFWASLDLPWNFPTTLPGWPRRFPTQWAHVALNLFPWDESQTWLAEYYWNWFLGPLSTVWKNKYVF